jgi:hypothetical protein
VEATLTLIRRLRRKPRGGVRLSYDMIAAKLNTDGIQTRTGKKWVGGYDWGYRVLRPPSRHGAADAYPPAVVVGRRSDPQTAATPRVSFRSSVGSTP